MIFVFHYTNRCTAGIVVMLASDEEQARARVLSSRKTTKACQLTLLKKQRVEGRPLFMEDEELEYWGRRAEAPALTPLPRPAK